jgi:glycine oxidase
MKEILIVGNGLSATVLAHTYLQHQVSFTLIGNQTLSNCSNAAAGIWNPIVFKRMTKSWLADDLIHYLVPFYEGIEKQFTEKVITHRPITKLFFEEQEKNLWQKKSTTELQQFLDNTIYTNPPTHFKNCLLTPTYSYVKQSGTLNVKRFVEQSLPLFQSNYVNEIFNYANLIIEPDFISYNNQQYKTIIFCEGFLVNQNPYFNWIPLKPAKGETLTIQSNALEIGNTILNKNGFLFNLNSNVFLTGSTYAWDDLSQQATPKGEEELKQKLTQLITSPYSVINHQAGIRPSSSDRRPIIGAHPKHKNMFIFNGLGTKGVMLAPYFAKNFVNFYLQKQPINKDVDVTRFYNLYKHANN